MNIRDGFACLLLEHRKTQNFVRIGDVNQVMRHARPLFVRGLGRPDVHAAIKETRIRRNDLAVESLSELDCELRLAHGRRADKEDEGLSH